LKKSVIPRAHASRATEAKSTLNNFSYLTTKPYTGALKSGLKLATPEFSTVSTGCDTTLMAMIGG
jgi:hypothetical protein